MVFRRDGKIVDISIYVNDPLEAWKKIKFDKELQIGPLLVIKSICQWREVLAQRYNINLDCIISGYKNSFYSKNLSYIQDSD